MRRYVYSRIPRVGSTSTERARDAMHRLNVTEVERLCYSRRKLRAISALRSAGINPGTHGMSKEYRVMGVKGKVYLVEHPDGTFYHFTRLDDMLVYAADYQTWKAQQQVIPDWHDWRRHYRKPKPPLTECQWDQGGIRCSYPAATCFPDDTVLCTGHTFIYEIMLREWNKKRAS